VTTSDALTVEAVVARFRESEATLQQLQERLLALALANDIATSASRSLDAAASSLADFVGELRSVVEQTAEAQSTTAEALKAAQAFLSTTDLGRVAAGLDGVASATSSSQKGIENLGTAVHNQHKRLDVLEKRVDDVRSVVEDLADTMLKRFDSLLAGVEDTRSHVGDVQRLERQKSLLEQRLERVTLELSGRQRNRLKDVLQ
jgi:chromosome segregation ATPase